METAPQETVTETAAATEEPETTETTQPAAGQFDKFIFWR